MDGMESTFSLMGIWSAMGWLAKGVVIVLFAMSVWSLSLAIERLWRFSRARRESLTLAEGVTPLLKHNKIDEAISLAREKRFKHSHLARVIAAGLSVLRRDPGEELPADYSVVESGKRAVEREALMVTADMKKGLGNLATISTTAPFIGLFGTVVGIINAFRGMAASGSGGLGAVSSGISEALATTAFGLFVAIPAVWLYNHFMSRIERFQVEMTNASSELVDFFIRNEARVKAR